MEGFAAQAAESCLSLSTGNRALDRTLAFSHATRATENTADAMAAGPRDRPRDLREGRAAF